MIGNSVFSIGFLGSLSSKFRGLVGGEITEYTSIISEGRHLSFDRVREELGKHGASGGTGISSELIFHAGNVEFLAIGSGVHTPQAGPLFTSSASAQELYAQVDAHYQPLSFVFGNVAYSIGIGRGFTGMLRSMSRGEVKEFSELFNTTRHRALQRIVDDAKKVQANSVVGIRTSIIPFGAVGVQEMVMIGTASKNPTLPASDEIVTSDLTTEELWAMAKLGYAPKRMLLSTSVYSLGIVGGFTAMLKSFVRGEISQLTRLIYDAREHALEGIRRQAQAINADEVVGVQTHIYQLGGGLIEFLALGTAVSKVGPQVAPRSEQLPPQAFLPDRDTFLNAAEFERAVDLNSEKR